MCKKEKLYNDVYADKTNVAAENLHLLGKMLERTCVQFSNVSPNFVMKQRAVNACEKFLALRSVLNP